ncbi:MAG TPA: 4-carboxymuconolactone decarboxylase [Patescibacteria group bacterium]|nr:4-carboxymuconolactone decarboxylase [Patescibacteria group bacterium]
MDERERFEQGITTRRAVLGDQYVDRALANRTDFNREFQDLITRYAWGEMWTRPGLDRKQRSLITLGMLIALNRTDEFPLHARGALRNGATREEIKEVLLQATVYCGVPAANTFFKIAKETFAEIDAAGEA